jgi:signal transduction histidine kinase
MSRRRAYGTGSLYVRTTGRGREIWYGQFRIAGRQVNCALGPKRRPGCSDGLTRTQAERKLRQLIEATRPLPPERLTIEEAGRRLVAHLAELGRKRSTLAAYESCLAATVEERRRVVRDLRDGPQQRLVQTIITLKMASRALQHVNESAADLVAAALDNAEQANVELRELAHGILPAVLTRGGLRAGVDALRARLDLLVRIDIPDERYPSEIEASAYFIVAEALTNVVKHSRAERADVKTSVEDGELRIEVRDYGVGGADPQGHGLLGLADRVTAFGGQVGIHSPLDGGTRVTAIIPLPR